MTGSSPPEHRAPQAGFSFRDRLSVSARRSDDVLALDDDQPSELGLDALLLLKDAGVSSGPQHGSSDAPSGTIPALRAVVGAGGRDAWSLSIGQMFNGALWTAALPARAVVYVGANPSCWSSNQQNARRTVGPVACRPNANAMRRVRLSAPPALRALRTRVRDGISCTVRANVLSRFPVNLGPGTTERDGCARRSPARLRGG